MSIQLPPNSTGTVVDTNTVAAKDREVINIGDPAAANTASVQATSPVRAAQRLSVGATPTTLIDPALTTSNLGISGNFTSSWFAAADGGECFVEVAVRADVASAANGFIIEESDATADANFTRTAARATVSANTTTYLRARIRSANWRVNYTNGGTAQTSFRIAYRTAPAAFLETFADFDTDATNVQPAEMVGIALPGAGGPVAGGTSTNPLRTDPTGTTTQPVSGTVTVQQATAANLKMDLSGTGANTTAIKVDNSAVTQPVSGTVTANAGTGNFNNAAVGATGSAVPSSADSIGARAATANPTAATGGNLVGVMADKAGRLVVVPGHVRDLVTDAATTISTTTETTILAAVASTFLDLTALILANTSATAVRVDIRDATAGTVRMSLQVPAGQTVGAVLQVPRPQTAVNNNWTAQLSAAVTDVRIWAQAVKNV